MRQLAAVLPLLLLVACERVPEEVVAAFEDATKLEQAMLRPLKEATRDTAPERLEELRNQYITESARARARAREHRAHIRELLNKEIEKFRLSNETLVELKALNEEALRCHQILERVGERWIEFLASGDSEAGFRHGFWGLIDIRDCFEVIDEEWRRQLRNDL